ncbi:MAG: hypothetical protein R3F43_20475 [bacterium]
MPADPVAPQRLRTEGRAGDVTRAFGLAALLPAAQRGVTPDLATPAATFGERLAAVAAGHEVALGLTVASTAAGSLDAPWFAEDRGTLILPVSPIEAAGEIRRSTAAASALVRAALASPPAAAMPVAASQASQAASPARSLTTEPAVAPGGIARASAAERLPIGAPIASPALPIAALLRGTAEPALDPLERWLPGAAPRRAAGFGHPFDATLIVPTSPLTAPGPRAPEATGARAGSAASIAAASTIAASATAAAAVGGPAAGVAPASGGVDRSLPVVAAPAAQAAGPVGTVATRAPVRGRPGPRRGPRRSRLGRQGARERWLPLPGRAPPRRCWWRSGAGR